MHHLISLVLVVVEALRYAGFGEGPFHLDDLQCTGDEESLFQCPHNGVGSHDCGYYDDAGVVCYTGE